MHRSWLRGKEIALTNGILQKADGAWKLNIFLKFIKNDDADYIVERLHIRCSNPRKGLIQARNYDSQDEVVLIAFD